jgi:hypothetical protein
MEQVEAERPVAEQPAAGTERAAAGKRSLPERA